MTRTLAIDGGTPLRTMPMPGWPAPGDDEVAAVTDVLRSARINYWTGEQGRLLEAEYASSLCRTHAIAVANGTLALELALRAFEIGAGDEVVVPARTFIATASAVVAVGATPVVADVDPASCVMSAETVAAVLTSRTRAVIPVHLGGWPVDMTPLLDLATSHDLIVIEDCAQAHGASYHDRPVGALGSHAAAFSFCQDKIVPAGDGGLLALDDDAAYERAFAYKDHGKSLAKLRDAELMAAPGVFKWLHDSFGSNWRLDEMTAAVARVGLGKLPVWHTQRAGNAMQLADGLEGLAALSVPMPPDHIEHGFYRLYAYVRPDLLSDGWDRDRIIAAVNAEGIPCQYGSCAEIYRERAFVNAGLGPTERLAGAQHAHETSLAFLVHPTLEPADISDTITATRAVMEAATR